MIDRILLPLDGSAAAESALPYAEQIARALHAHVTLLRAIDVPAEWAQHLAQADLGSEESAAGEYLEEIAAALRHRSINVEHAVSQLPPAQAILERAREGGAGLIAMATHGRSGVSRWTLGSVADTVLHRTETPLLLVRPSGEEDASRTAPPITKILVPLDGSELSQAALPFAEELAKALPASITLFHAVMPPVMAYPGGEFVAMDQRLWESLEERARGLLSVHAAALEAAGIETERRTSLIPEVDGIIGAARDSSAGLVLMSTHGRSGVGRWIMGSVADGVVRRSHIPCLLIRPKMEAPR